MTQNDMERAYSDYMARKKAVWSQIAELWQGLYLRVEPHLMDIFKAGAEWQAAQSAERIAQLEERLKECERGHSAQDKIDAEISAAYRMHNR